MGYLREPSYCSTWEHRWLLEILDYRLVVAVQSLSESESLWPHGLQHARPPCPSLSLGVCSDSCPSRQRLSQLKTFRIIWELALSFLWFGEPVESGRGGGKKDEAGSRQESLWDESESKPRRVAGLVGHKRAWSDGNWQPGQKAAFCPTWGHNQLPICLSPWMENTLPPSKRSLIQVNKSLFKCRVFSLPFRNLNFDIWGQNRWTCFILSHSKETVVLSGCYLISLLFWGLPLLKTKRGKGRSTEGRFWPLSSFSLNTYLHTVARDGWKGACVNNILGTFGKRHF